VTNHINTTRHLYPHLT